MMKDCKHIYLSICSDEKKTCYKTSENRARHFRWGCFIYFKLEQFLQFVQVNQVQHDMFPNGCSVEKP